MAPNESPFCLSAGLLRTYQTSIRNFYAEFWILWDVNMADKAMKSCPPRHLRAFYITICVEFCAIHIKKLTIGHYSTHCHFLFARNWPNTTTISIFKPREFWRTCRLHHPVLKLVWLTLTWFLAEIGISTCCPRCIHFPVEVWWCLL